MHSRVSALVDRAGRLGRDMARHAAWEGELLEQLPHAGRVLANLRIDLAVATFQPGVRHHGRAPMSGTTDVENVSVALADDAVQVDIDEIETRRGAPVAEQARLDVLACSGSASNGLSIK